MRYIIKNASDTNSVQTNVKQNKAENLFAMMRNLPVFSHFQPSDRAGNFVALSRVKEVTRHSIARQFSLIDLAN